MFYIHKDTYNNHEVDCLVEKIMNEVIYEALSMQQNNTEVN